MLNLVTGPSGCGKTEYIRGVLGTLAENGQDKLLLIVPEQYSYDSERAMLEKFGNRTAQKVEVVTFSRLADYVFRTTGGNAGLIADDGTRLILMLRAMDAVSDKLDYYENYRNDVRLAKELIAVFREVRQSGAGLLRLEEAADKVKSTVLSKKLRELSLIFQMYDAMFRQRYSDEDLQIEKLCRVLDDTQFLRGYTLAIDGFKSFTGQELQLLGRILSQAEDVYVTLCTVGTHGEDKTSPSMVFASVDETGRRLRKMAEERNVRVFVRDEKHIDLARGRRYVSPELKFLEENLFVPQKSIYDGFAENLTICESRTVFDECEYIAATIRKLLREEGLRARDIAVIVRREDEYRKELENAFRRYDLPFFDDARQPVEHQPLVVLVRAVLALLSRGFTSENLLRYCKTGLAGVGAHEVAELENYVFIWDVKGPAWRSPFPWNPFGLDAAYKSDEEVEEALGLLNHTREQVMGPLLRLKKETGEASFREVGEALYRFLIRTNVPELLKNYAVSLDDAGLPDLAGEQDRVWDLCISVIDRLTAVYGDEACKDLRVYADLFDAILSVTDLGNIPQGLDEVRLSAADRVRLSSPNTVFVAGLEEGVFPAVIGSSGLFTLHERADLCDHGLELSFPENLRASEERFITYSAVTAPRQRLYLSWHRLSLSGDSYLPSELITAVRRLFTTYDEAGEEQIHYHAVSTDMLPADYHAETLSSAYQTYAKQVRSEDRASLAAVREALTGLDETGTYQKKLEALDTVLRPRPFRIEDPSIATELFRKDMNLSASRVDNYYHCAFQYFCRYGLNAEPRKRAALGANHYGTIIHYVLEQLLKETDKASFVAYTEKELQARVDHWLAVYAEQDLGGLADKTTRFQYLYNRLTLILYDVAQRLQEELKVSDFVPSDFELPIGSGEEVPSYTLALPDGGTLAVRGSVDRVDLYEHDGKTYVRVVDYKSGGKEFELSDILYGLNLQMLLYLFTIEQNGTGKYDDIIPAGILYYPAKRKTGTVAGRDASADTVDKSEQAKDKENGLFLRDEDILEAMENGLEGRFLPVTRDKKGGFKSEKSLASLSELGQLRRRIDFLLKKMATELHEGDIAAVPALQNEKYLPCDYCDYRSVCRQDEPEPRVIEKFTDREELMAKMNDEEVEAHAE